jgi:hypothetical protein
MDKLAKVVRGFLTPDQTVQVSQTVLKVLVDSKATYHGRDDAEMGNSEASSEQRMGNSFRPDSANGPAIGPQATSYILIANLSSIILSSLPLHTLESDGSEEVRGLVRGIVHLVEWQKEQSHKWRGEEGEAFLAASLRLEYMLRVARGLELSPELWHWHGQVNDFMSLADDVVKGELKFESVCDIDYSPLLC